jgi:hypothetical protein
MNTPIPPTTLQPDVKAQAIVEPEASSKYQAYRRIGLIQGIDYTFTALILAHFIVALFAVIFGKMTTTFGIVLAVQAYGLALAWILLLVYRVGVFVVELRANVELLPFDSARIAVGFLQGGTPLNTPVKK